MANHSSSYHKNPIKVWKGKRYDIDEETSKSEVIQCATGEAWRPITNFSRKNEEAEPKQKWHSVVDVSGGKSNVWCFKAEYCIGTLMLGPWIQVNWK